MLVLSRKVGEAIFVGETKVIITKVTGNRVTVAFEAPPDVRVVRAELKKKDDTEK